MKLVYFVNHDVNMHERRSDGAEFCVIPEFHDNKIYFYCSEYEMFWGLIEDAGNYERSLNFKLKGKIRPATLKEIHTADLCRYVDSVKEYTVENGRVIDVRRIHLSV